MNFEELKTVVYSLPNVVEKPHFDRVSFSSAKRIFATYHQPSNSANLKLSDVDQDVYSVVCKGMVYPVPNKWGIQGWTTFELTNIPEDICLEALNLAYQDSLI